MQMSETYRNDRYKILEVTLSAGEAMPLHQASSDAFVIARKGKGKISFNDRTIILSEGESYLIPAHEQHKLEILNDFKSNIVLAAEATIDFV
ncbi:MAG: cupin domain-containing protein [Bacteroidetes bacterium]|nr:cupin domain-containing protein [Bacteroidota bacterium]MBS1739564.1 cupin domain-containing protein [Bacteroidota bacterium]MBS1776538.1 cupin domain-containing protein [Bacteroidota bacterium]